VKRHLVALDQEAVVLGVEDRSLVVIAGELSDRVERIPEREHEELALVVDVAGKHPHAAIAGRLRVARHCRAGPDPASDPPRPL
jgi:hypothetical protein